MFRKFQSVANVNSQKMRFTPEGGLAVKLTNGIGSATIKGMVVRASSSGTETITLQSAEFDSIGVCYESGVVNGADTWVVIAGIADVLLADGAGSTRGHWVSAAPEDGRALTTTVPSPPNSDSHFKEIGHCLETNSAACAGTSVTVKCILHFN